MENQKHQVSDKMFLKHPLVTFLMMTKDTMSLFQLTSSKMSFPSFSFTKTLLTNLFQKLKINSYTLNRTPTILCTRGIKGKTEIWIWIKRQQRQITKNIKIIKAVKNIWVRKSRAQSKKKKRKEVLRKKKFVDIQNQQLSSKFNLCKIIKSQNSYLHSLIIFRVLIEILCYYMIIINTQSFKVKVIKIFNYKTRINWYLKSWKRWSWRIGKIIESLIKENLELIVF